MSEWLTDKEKRILFSALTREKRVCIQVDKQRKASEQYEPTLQSVCDSLEHKFYYDRLFKQIEKQMRTETINECLEIVKFHRDSWDGIEWAIRDIEELSYGGNGDL